MKKYYLILLIILPVFTFGQDTIQKTKKLPKQNCIEIYNVLRSNKSIFQGSYKKINDNGILLIEGYYKNGAKEGIWKEYNLNGTISKIGNYNSNKMIGIWNFYDNSGNPEIEYDFSSKKLVSFNINDYEKDKEYSIITVDITQTVVFIKDKLDRPPLYLGSSTEIQKILNSNLKYPVLAKDNNIQGTVEISFIIDKNGKTSDYKVTQWIDRDCDAEALRVVKMIPENWIPAIYKGKTVSVEYQIRIKFSLS